MKCGAVEKVGKRNIKLENRSNLLSKISKKKSSLRKATQELILNVAFKKNIFE